MEFRGSDIISVNQFDLGDINTLFALAHRLRKIATGELKCKILDGFILGNLFFEASTRSRMSFASAFMRLGGQVNSTTGVAFSSMSKGETLADTISVIQSYCDILAIRHPQLGAAQEAARASKVPVINAGDGPGEHPTQALLDLFTIFEERKQIHNSTIAMVGDLKYGRTVHSLAKLLTLYQGIRYIFVAPSQVQMPDGLVEELKAKGYNVSQTDKLEEGIRDANVIYSTRIQEERFDRREEYEAIKNVYVLDREMVLRTCNPDVTILHPLPRTTEIAVDVDALPNAAYFRQSANGLMIRMALFLLILGKEQELV
ncbi:MAG: aspartate carbamoyltransferase [Rhabdochlamydiaceae bacterium]|nr:aspartate carbamoyltransferase [Rhabdochlamydiaceae bacterium]MBP9773112.1 aspartate carbamoyltransferase [Candidatus Peribacteraceae bacterium]